MREHDSFGPATTRRGRRKFDDDDSNFVKRGRLEPAVAGSATSLASLRAAPRSNVPYTEGELVPVAKTDNMDVVYWVRRPADDANKWTIAVLEGGGVTWAQFDGGIVDYLGATFDGSFRVPFLPEDFPSDDLAFQPAPEAA